MDCGEKKPLSLSVGPSQAFCQQDVGVNGPSSSSARFLISFLFVNTVVYKLLFHELKSSSVQPFSNVQLCRVVQPFDPFTVNPPKFKQTLLSQTLPVRTDSFGLGLSLLFPPQELICSRVFHRPCTSSCSRLPPALHILLQLRF